MGTNTIMSKSETKYQRLPVDDHEAEYKPTFTKKLPIVGGLFKESMMWSKLTSIKKPLIAGGFLMLLIFLAVTLVLIFVIPKNSSENKGKYMPQYLI